MLEDIAKTPIPTLLIVAGILFLLFAVGGSIGANFNTSNINRGMAGIVGVCFLVGGLMLWAMKVDDQGKSPRTARAGSGGESTRPVAIPTPLPNPKTSGFDNMGPLEPNSDRFGDDIGSGINVSNGKVASCQKMCADNPQCQAFTYAKPYSRADITVDMCFLKSGPGNRQANNCCVSGLKIK